MKYYIFDSKIFSLYDMNNNLKKLSKFIIENRSDINIEQDHKTKLFDSIKVLSKTPISNIFNYDRSLTNTVNLVDLTTSSDIPEILLWKHFNVDVKIIEQFNKQAYNALSVFTEYRDKILYNITDILSADKTKITNHHIFLKSIARDLCSRSYFNYDDMWLTGKLLRQLVDFYSMAMSMTISRIYNFEYQEQIYIATIFAYYFVSKCIDNPEDAKAFVRSCKFLGDNLTISATMRGIEEALEEKDITEFSTQEQLIMILKELSPKRIDNMDVKVFNTMCRTFNLDQITSIMSIDYPAYWLYNVLCVLSGDKSNLMFTFKRGNYMKKAIEFGRDLIIDKNFYSSLR